MGNIFCQSTPKDCPINLSENCIERLTREEKESKATDTQIIELNLPENLTEEEQRIKLRCYDENHSEEYGLTFDCFNQFIDEIESRIAPIDTTICSAKELINCLKQNPFCSIKCHRLMECYIDCIDKARINLLKKRLEECKNVDS